MATVEMFSSLMSLRLVSSLLSLPLSQLTSKSALLLILYFVVRTVYRLCFHPLAALRGPRLAAVTSWWTYLVDRTGYAEEEYERLHKLYNTRALQIGPNEVHVSDTSKYAVIYSNSKPFLKDPYFYAMFPAQDALAVMTDPGRHDETRRHMNPAFSRTGILNLQPLINQHLDHLREKMTAVCVDGPIVLYDAMRCMTMDIISQFCFGQSANLKEEDPKGFDAQWLRIFDKDVYVLAEFRYWPFILKLGSIMPMWVYSWLSPDSLNFTDFLNYAIKAIQKYRSQPNIASESDHPILFDRIKHRPDKEIVQEAMTILAGGSDPTSAVLIQGIMQLLKSPERIARLRAELKTVILTRESHCSLLELERLEFLSACVKESIRFATPVPGRLPRVVPAGGMLVDGQFIAQGCVVGMSSYTMHHATDIWGEDAADFRPERWLGERGKVLDKYMVAFSKGKRMCIGINLAYAEIHMTLAMLFRSFDMVPAPEHSEESMKKPDFFTRVYVNGGPLVTVWPTLA